MTRNLALFAGVGLLFLLTGYLQSWNLALSILNLSLISAIMALGVNIQWGYAGLFNTGIMGFTALGGLAMVLVSARPVAEGWAAGGTGILAGLFIGAASIALAIFAFNRLPKGKWRTIGTLAIARHDIRRQRVGVAFDQLGHYSTLGFDTKRKRSDI